MTDEPETKAPASSLAASTPPTTSPPAPGDPEYDAFLREVQRLADERQAAQVAEIGSRDPRTVLKLILLALIWVVGLALVLSAAWLEISWDAASTAADAALGAAAAGAGIACIAIGAVGFFRTLHRRSD